MTQAKQSPENPGRFNLSRYVTDGRAAIDNNVCERDVRPFVTSRKSWLFSDTVDGA
ncbi:hypothetical protein QFZ94_006723 [Paraburkholderia sp. JPY465]